MYRSGKKPRWAVTYMERTMMNTRNVAGKVAASLIHPRFLYSPSTQAKLFTSQMVSCQNQ